MKQHILMVFMIIMNVVILITAERSLKMVQVVSRHCDRNTVNEANSDYGYIPSDKINFEKELGVQRGKLTGLGVAQCVELGKKIRQRYVEDNGDTQIQGINPEYKSTQYEFVSTDLDRTLRSMWSVSQGIFPPGKNGPRVDVNVGDLYKGNFSLPFGATSIPIQSTKGDDDIRLRAYSASKCVRIKDNLNQYRHSEDYNQVVERNKNTIEQVQQWADLKILDFDEFYKFFDLMVVQKSHNLLTSALLNQNFNQLQEIAFESHYAQFRSEVLGLYGGGVFLNDIFNDFVAANKPDVDHILYRHHSAHDSTLQAIIAALGIDVDHPELREIPQYGAALAFELWFDEERNTSDVRIVYSNKYSNPTWTSYNWGKVCDDNNFCPIENITNIGISPDQWCSDCQNDIAKTCLKMQYEKTHIWNIVLLIVAPLMVTIIFILLIVVFAFILFMIYVRKHYVHKTVVQTTLEHREGTYEEF
mmetsp:Transcript_3656/g.5406  ORF Transcript_3656/g.5406 Transcript_3656/m.5406 type:complete len:473 (-) Transcript_3656:13-1431(-)